MAIFLGKNKVNVLGGICSSENTPSEGITPSGTISITQNGTVNVTNYAWANVNVSIPLQDNKSINLSENAQTVHPDSGYNGFSSITIPGIPNTYIGSQIQRINTTSITPGAQQIQIGPGYLGNILTIQGIAFQTYYTGSATPSSSLGNDGDIYLQA